MEDTRDNLGTGACDVVVAVNEHRMNISSAHGFVR